MCVNMSLLIFRYKFFQNSIIKVSVWSVAALRCSLWLPMLNPNLDKSYLGTTFAQNAILS